RQLEARSGAPSAGQLGRKAHQLPLPALGPRLVQLDAEPARHELEEVGRGEVRIEVLVKGVEGGDDRVEDGLESPHELHPEVALAVDRREAGPEVGAGGDGGRDSTIRSRIAWSSVGYSRHRNSVRARGARP